jgi:hypothetical protein
MTFLGNGLITNNANAYIYLLLYRDVVTFSHVEKRTSIRNQRKR